MNVKTGQRVVKNKAKDQADQGSTPWDDDQRQQLVDYHASLETWEKVAKMLERSNQAVRLEWNKMLNGRRDQEKQGYWEQKAKACEEQRKIKFSSKGSKARNTTVAAPDAGEPAKYSSSSSYRIKPTSRRPEPSSNTTSSRNLGSRDDDDDVADTVRYRSLGSEYYGVEPHESRMLFRKREAWYTDRKRRLWYLHPWGFRRESSLKGYGIYTVDCCKGLSGKEIATDLHKMGIGC